MTPLSVQTADGKGRTHGLIVIDDNFASLDAKEPDNDVLGLRILRDVVRATSHFVAAEFIDLPLPDDHARVTEMHRRIEETLTLWRRSLSFTTLRVLIDNVVQRANVKVGARIMTLVKKRLGACSLKWECGYLSVDPPDDGAQWWWKRNIVDTYRRTLRLPPSLEVFLGMGDVLDWFLAPPGSDEEPQLQWFDDHLPAGMSSHNPKMGFFDEHLAALKHRFPDYDWECGTSAATPAKALLHSDAGVATAIANREYWMPAKNIQAILGSRLQVSDTLQTGLIALPVFPGLPFLCAMRQLFDTVNSESRGASETWELSRLDDDPRVLLLRTSTGRETGDLRVAIESGKTIGGVSPVYQNAMQARIGGRPRSRYLSGTFVGTKDRCVSPVIGPGFCGVSWLGAEAPH